MELVIGLSLSLVMLTSLLYSSILLKENLERGKVQQLLQMEASAFIHYLERELGCTEQVYISSRRMLFTCKGVLYDYRQSGSSIVREVDSKGWVQVCLHVKDFQVQPFQKGVVINLWLEKGGIPWKMQTSISYAR
ncbi:ComGF family competence protein [Ammoniphilus sp. YIM 78166]|uniref:ComGF family competence protein n=1 Tax=Ammoniphilus sp. YIM 78166 TaxID=1644106 RepID=UPI00106FBCDB|nr:ComGF family competence protein [Ammoniphilus sp. YIM 78166]